MTFQARALRSGEVRVYLCQRNEQTIDRDYQWGMAGGEVDADGEVWGGDWEPTLLPPSPWTAMVLAMEGVRL